MKMHHWMQMHMYRQKVGDGQSLAAPRDLLVLQMPVKQCSGYGTFTSTNLANSDDQSCGLSWFTCLPASLNLNERIFDIFVCIFLKFSMCPTKFKSQQDRDGTNSYFDGILSLTPICPPVVDKVNKRICVNLQLSSHMDPVLSYVSLQAEISNSFNTFFSSSSEHIITTTTTYFYFFLRNMMAYDDDEDDGSGVVGNNGDDTHRRLYVFIVKDSTHRDSNKSTRIRLRRRRSKK